MVETTWPKVFGDYSEYLPIETTYEGLAHEYEESESGIDTTIEYFRFDEPIHIAGHVIEGIGVCQRGRYWKVWAFKYEGGRLNSIGESPITSRHGIVIDSSEPSDEVEAAERAVEEIARGLAGETE